MTLDSGFASVIAAAIAAVASIASVAIATRQSRRVTETHRQVTVNHHSSESPTLLDLFDDVLTEQRATRADVNSLRSEFNGLRSEFNGHITHSNEMDARLMAVENEVRNHD